MRKTVKLALLALAVTGAVVWHAAQLRPCRSMAGAALAGTTARPTADDQILRVATFNIHGAAGSDGRRDLARVAECLKGFDVVALNEVHGSRLTTESNQADDLGRRLGMASLFAPNTRRWYCLEFGNGLLSRLPAERWESRPLDPPAPRGFRNMIHAVLRAGPQEVQVLVTHVARSDDACRRAQLHAVVEYFLALAKPAVLLGDLNTEPGDPEIGRLLAAPGVVDCAGQSLGEETPPRIDWIVARGMRCRTAGIVERGASDHPLFWAELNLKERP